MRTRTGPDAVLPSTTWHAWPPDRPDEDDWDQEPPSLWEAEVLMLAEGAPDAGGEGDRKDAGA